MENIHNIVIALDGWSGGVPLLCDIDEMASVAYIRSARPASPYSMYKLVFLHPPGSPCRNNLATTRAAPMRCGTVSHALQGAPST